MAGGVFCPVQIGQLELNLIYDQVAETLIDF